MKKIWTASILLLLLVTLSGCQMLTIDQHIKEIKEKAPADTLVEKTEKVYLTNPDFPELVVFFTTKEHTTVEVHQYNQQTKKWSIVYTAKPHNHYGGLEQLTILNTFKNEKTSLEHIFIGYHGGSGGFLNFYALGGTKDGHVTEVVTNMLHEYPNSSIKQTENGFALFSNDEQVASYFWDDYQYLLTE